MDWRTSLRLCARRGATKTAYLADCRETILRSRLPCSLKKNDTGSRSIKDRHDTRFFFPSFALARQLPGQFLKPAGNKGCNLMFRAATVIDEKGLDFSPA
jgi:hypothetical protein